jgi:hypothetical protein
MVTEAGALAFFGLALGLGVGVVNSPALAAPRVAVTDGVAATGVTAVSVVDEQAETVITAAVPAIVQNPLTVYRMCSNLAWQAWVRGYDAPRALRLCGGASR